MSVELRLTFEYSLVLQILVMLLIPSPYVSLRDRLTRRTILGLPTGSFMSYLAGGTMTTFTVIAFFGLVFPSRLITRLSLIRSRPASAPNSTPKEFIRMSHMGHQMLWGKRSQPRELPVQDVEVKVILGRQTKGGERGESQWWGGGVWCASRLSRDFAAFTILTV